MKKNIFFWLTGAATVLSVIFLFTPFITIENYDSVSGFSLIIHLFQKFEIAKTSKNAYNALFLIDTSAPLLLVLLLLLVSILLYFLYFKKKDQRFLSGATATTICSLVAYGAQLSNSNTLPSDFFGSLLDGIPYGKGKFIFQIADDVTVNTGIGARVLAITLFVAALCAVLYLLYDYIEKVEQQTVLTPFIIAYRQFISNKLAVIGLCVLLFAVVACFFGPVFSPYSLLDTDVANTYQGMSHSHIFGTDEMGRDELARLLFGGRISLSVGFVAVFCEVILGTLIGGIAGFYRGRVDNFIMRIVDIFMCLPFLPVVIICAAVMSDLKIDPQARIYFVMLILGVLAWPSFARLLRGQMLNLRSQDFILAEEVLGVRDRKKILYHFIPNAIPMLIVTATLDFGGMILSETTLSFLGLGISTPYPSWGNLLQAVNDSTTLQMRPWLWVPAGVCIAIVILSINLFGDGLRDALDPKMKK